MHSLKDIKDLMERIDLIESDRKTFLKTVDALKPALPCSYAYKHKKTL